MDIRRRYCAFVWPQRTVGISGDLLMNNANNAKFYYILDNANLILGCMNGEKVCHYFMP